MPRISKRVLLESVVQAITAGGWVVDVLSRLTEHPMRLRMRQGGKTHIARIYIWSLTHGGGLARPGHEYRIQITSGVTRFVIEAGEKTVILGWSAEFGVYAAFDVTRHTARLGSSPSIQISKTALLRAGEVGIAAHIRGREEVALAVRPDLLPAYIDRLEVMHHKASVDGQIAEIQRDRQPPDAADTESDAETERVASYLRAGRKPRFGDANELKQRKTIIDRLEALERHIGIGPQEPAKIGHNKPPEPIDPQAVSPDPAVSAARAISDEIAKPSPNLTQVSEKTGVLARIGRGLRIARQEAADLGKRVITKAKDKAAELTIGVIAGGGIFHQQIGTAMNAALDSITTWFRMIF
jgi:hypothetical protein